MLYWLIEYLDMFKTIIHKNPLLTILTHVLLGLAATQYHIVLLLWFYLILLSSINALWQSARSFNAYGLVAYLCSFEIINRINGSSVLMPYEMGKYSLFVFFLYGILSGSQKSIIGYFMAFLLIPAMFIDPTGKLNYQNIVFNALGPLNIALGIIYFTSISISEKQFQNLLQSILYPLVSVAAYVFVRTPDYNDITFGLVANFETSGGFGSNQVSTVLGLGGFICALFFILRWKLSGIRILDAALFFAFTFQAILTFSRGGVIGEFLAIAVVIYFLGTSGILSTSRYKVPNFALYIIPLIFLGYFAFATIDEISGGNLTLRYQGETSGTQAGAKEVDINTVTSNRYTIFMEDLEVMKEHPILGAGVGVSEYLRETTEDVSAHVELSRLLAEHGLLGLVYFILWVFSFFAYIWPVRHPVYRAVSAALFILAFYTTFHSANRTYVSALLVSISMITVKVAPQTIRSRKTTKPYYGV